MTRFITNKIQAALLFFVMFLATYFANQNFPGQSYLLYGFTFIFYIFILSALMFSSTFFSIFLVLFLSLGLWIKLIYHLIVNNYSLGDTIGRFDFSGPAFDKLIIFSISGILGFTSASIIGFVILKKVSFLRTTPPQIPEALVLFYYKYKIKILSLAVLFFSLFSFINLYFQIYQRGTISRISNPAIQGVTAWAMLFGLSAVATVFLNIDYKNKKSLGPATLVSFFETFTSSISILSRGFILNAGSILLVLILVFKQGVLISKKQLVFFFIVFLGFFLISVKSVTLFRFQSYVITSAAAIANGPGTLSQSISHLLIDRWVGLEGVMSTTSFTGDRESLFKRIWQEKMHPGTSIYDKEITYSYYSKEINRNQQFVTIPGFIGWLGILDNLYLVFTGAFFIGLFCISLELIANKFLNNIFFMSLIGQVMAYRVTHSGYLPKQSYKLFGSIILTCVFLVLLNLLFSKKMRSTE